MGITTECFWSWWGARTGTDLGLVLGALLVASLMGIRLLELHRVQRLRACTSSGSSDAGGGARTSPGWPFARRRVTFRRCPHGFTPPILHLALHLTTMEEWARSVGAGAVQGDVLIRWRSPAEGPHATEYSASRQCSGGWTELTIIPDSRLSRPGPMSEAQSCIACDWRALIEWAEQKQYPPRRLLPLRVLPGPFFPGSLTTPGTPVVGNLEPS